MLIRRRLLRAIDHQYVDRAFRRVEVQAELLLDGREDRRRVAVRNWWRSAGLLRPIASGRTDAGVRRVIELDVIRPGQSRLVDDDAPGETRERLRERRHRRT